MGFRLERRAEFAIGRIERPEALNALSFGLLEEMSAALDEVASWPVRALILIGAGDKAFCAGADIAELRGRDVLAERAGLEAGKRVFDKLEALPVPSVAVVNGYALGGGLELALACTFRLATAGARFALPEIKLGLIPGYGGTQRLPRLIGQGRALEMILTGEEVRAEQAERIGLVSRIVTEEPVEAGIAFARRFARFSLPALALARQAVLRGLDASLADGLAIETDIAALSFRTADAAEGLTAFLEKRKPEFKDA